MAEVISEKKAQQSVLALGTATMGVMSASSEEEAQMYKDSRDSVYEDMDSDSLKRIIRWAMRQNIGHFVSLCLMTGQDPEEVWRQMALQVSATSEGE